MSKSVIFVSLLLLLGFASNGISGVEAGNGGGLAEKYIQFAYLNLSEYVTLFYENIPSEKDGDSLKLKEIEVLNGITESMLEEYKTENQIELVSEKEHPGFFDTGEPSRIAKTGDNVGDKVYINEDLLYSSEADGMLKFPITPSIAVSILVHEFGHHHNVKDHLFLDRLGSKIQKMIEARTLEAIFYGKNYVYTAEFIAGSKKHLIVSDAYKSVDLGASLIAKISWCKNNETPVNYKITNLFWSSQAAYDGTSSDLPPQTLRAQMIAICRSRIDFSDRAVYPTREVAISFNTKYKDSRETPWFEVLDCYQHPQRCW